MKHGPEPVFILLSQRKPWSLRLYHLASLPSLMIELAAKLSAS